ncbi:MAG: hypothetical protein ABR992_15530 [Solirubrobacteraceae bacterium]|jgi:hypothetical protein
MSAANEHTDHELVVAPDGSIPADQLARLGVAPGAHLRVVQTAPDESASALAGSLSGFPDLTWEDFERASELARHDLPAA